MADSKLRKPKYTQMTDEQKVVHAAEVAKAAEDRKVEEARLSAYEKKLGTMSHRQLRGELTRTIKREYGGKPPEPQAGLTIGIASILLTVLDNTQTKDNPFAKLAHYLNPMPMQNHTKLAR